MYKNIIEKKTYNGFDINYNTIIIPVSISLSTSVKQMSRLLRLLYLQVNIFF